MKELSARCAMCPEPKGSRSYACTLFRPDLVSGAAYPCKFVRVFQDGVRLVRVCENAQRGLYKAHYRMQGTSCWRPVPSKFLPWCSGFDRAQMQLNFYAERKHWLAVWPLEEANL